MKRILFTLMALMMVLGIQAQTTNQDSVGRDTNLVESLKKDPAGIVENPLDISKVKTYTNTLNAGTTNVQDTIINKDSLIISEAIEAVKVSFRSYYEAAKLRDLQKEIKYSRDFKSLFENNSNVVLDFVENTRSINYNDYVDIAFSNLKNTGILFDILQLDESLNNIKADSVQYLDKENLVVVPLTISKLVSTLVDEKNRKTSSSKRLFTLLFRYQYHTDTKQARIADISLIDKKKPASYLTFTTGFLGSRSLSTSYRPVFTEQLSASGDFELTNNGLSLAPINLAWRYRPLFKEGQNWLIVNAGLVYDRLSFEHRIQNYAYEHPDLFQDPDTDTYLRQVALGPSIEDVKINLFGLSAGAGVVVIDHQKYHLIFNLDLQYQFSVGTQGTFSGTVDYAALYEQYNLLWTFEKDRDLASIYGFSEYELEKPMEFENFSVLSIQPSLETWIPLSTQFFFTGKLGLTSSLNSYFNPTNTEDYLFVSENEAVGNNTAVLNQESSSSFTQNYIDSFRASLIQLSIGITYKLP